MRNAKVPDISTYLDTTKGTARQGWIPTDEFCLISDDTSYRGWLWVSSIDVEEGEHPFLDMAYYDYREPDWFYYNDVAYNESDRTEAWEAESITHVMLMERPMPPDAL